MKRTFTEYVQIGLLGQKPMGEVEVEIEADITRDGARIESAIFEYRNCFGQHREMDVLPLLSQEQIAVLERNALELEREGAWA